MGNGDPEATCVLGRENKTKIDNLEREGHEMWMAIEGLRTKLDRLPAWATVVLMVLSAAVGVLATVASL